VELVDRSGREFTAAAKPLLPMRDLPAYLRSRINFSMVSLMTEPIKASSTPHSVCQR
jgi:hypothetical protein